MRFACFTSALLAVVLEQYRVAAISLSSSQGSPYADESQMAEVDHDWSQFSQTNAESKNLTDLYNRAISRSDEDENVKPAPSASVKAPAPTAP